VSSSDEREIREAVVTRLRAIMPGARIVHELNVAGQGSNRIDVAAVGERVIVAVEIKSEKDTLTRLSHQLEAFGACAHHVIVAAHIKHFKAYRDRNWRADVPDGYALDHEPFAGRGWWNHLGAVWPYPAAEGHQFISHDARSVPWNLPDRFIAWADIGGIRQPRAAAMLDMLWRDELAAEAGRHGIGSTSRTTHPQLVSSMVWAMTGREIATAVCRQLRGRRFAEADHPIGEAA